jgi:hypothetical protein
MQRLRRWAPYLATIGALSAGTPVAALAHPMMPMVASTASQTPVLGIKGAYINDSGFGTIRPRIVGFGGDATSYYTMVVWHEWGAATTKGIGRGFCAPLDGAPTADGHPCAVELYATKLGACARRTAYEVLTVYARYGDRWILYSGKHDPICKKGL